MNYTHTLNGVPIQVSSHIPCEYKTTKITYHRPVYIPKHIKRYSYKQTEYVKRETKGYNTFVADLPMIGKVIMMHPDVFEKLKNNKEIRRVI